MSEKSANPRITLPHGVRLDGVNAMIAKLAAASPHTHVYGIFTVAGRLARRAVDTALEIPKSPGVELAQIEPVLDFWYRLSDYAHTAALNCAGGNQTLAEALITYQLLQTTAAEAAEEATDARK